MTSSQHVYEIRLRKDDSTHPSREALQRMKLILSGMGVERAPPACVNCADNL
jgi:hypothetical protein